MPADPPTPPRDAEALLAADERAVLQLIRDTYGCRGHTPARTEIAGQLHLTSAVASKIVHRLAELGLLERRPLGPGTRAHRYVPAGVVPGGHHGVAPWPSPGTRPAGLDQLGRIAADLRGEASALRARAVAIDWCAAALEVIDGRR